MIFVAIYSLSCFLLETSIFGNDAGLEKLRKHYEGIKGLDANIVQVRYSKYLKKPVTSDIILSWSPESFIWKVLRPVPFTLISEKGLVKVDSGEGPEFPGQVKQGMSQIINFIEHLISANINALTGEFELILSGSTLTATPKDTEKSIINKPVKLTFQSDMSLESIVIGTGPDRSELKVQKLKIIRK